MELWKQADEALLSLRGRRAKLDAEELQWLDVARREKTYEKCGFATFFDYIRNRLGVEGRTAFEYQRVAIVLPELPGIAAALADARLTFTGVRDLTRVATPETEGVWLEKAAGQTVERIKEMVSGRIKGDRPETPPRLEETVKVRTFELRNATDALLRQAKQVYEKEIGRSVSDDELIAELARGKIAAVAEGKTRKSLETQVVITVCPTCEGARQLGAGKYVRIDPEELEGIDFGPVITLDSARKDSDTDEIPAWVRRHVFLRDGGRCRCPGCSSTKNLHFHHIIYRENGGSHDPSNIALICGAHHRAHHRGHLVIWGTTQDAIDFRHADGTPYGSLPALPPPA